MSGIVLDPAEVAGVQAALRALAEARRLVVGGVLAVGCPLCRSRPGWRCTRDNGRGKLLRPHPQRGEAHRAALWAVLGVEGEAAA